MKNKSFYLIFLALFFLTACKDVIVKDGKAYLNNNDNDGRSAVINMKTGEVLTGYAELQLKPNPNVDKLEALVGISMRISGEPDALKHFTCELEIPGQDASGNYSGNVNVKVGYADSSERDESYSDKKDITEAYQAFGTSSFSFGCELKQDNGQLYVKAFINGILIAKKYVTIKSDFPKGYFGFYGTDKNTGVGWFGIPSVDDYAIEISNFKFSSERPITPL